MIITYIITLGIFFLNRVYSQEDNTFINTFGGIELAASASAPSSVNANTLITRDVHPYNITAVDPAQRGYYPLFDRRTLVDPNASAYVQRWNLNNIEIPPFRRPPLYDFNPLMDRMRRFRNNIRTTVPGIFARSVARTTAKLRRFALNGQPLYRTAPDVISSNPATELRPGFWNTLPE